MNFAFLYLLVACNTPPTVDGKVVDIWGEPLEGATVLMVGTAEKPLTDHEGRYSFTFAPGTHSLKAGKEGYIQEHTEVTFAEGQTPEGPLFELYQKPSEEGFFAIGTSSYVHLKPQLVHTVGSDFDPVRGLKTMGDAKVSESELKVVFHSDFRYEEVLKLGLELQKLSFIEKRNVSGPLGETEVSINLHTAEKEVEIEIAAMRSPTDYLITVKGELEPGYYAFQTFHMLDSQDQEAFDRLPPELRNVFPFEYK